MEEFAHKRDVLHQHCAELGRDPAEILLSSHVRFEGDPAATAADRCGARRGRRRAGHRPAPAAAHPGVLEPLAEALAELG